MLFWFSDFEACPDQLKSLRFSRLRIKDLTPFLPIALAGEVAETLTALLRRFLTFIFGGRTVPDRFFTFGGGKWYLIPFHPC